MRQPPRLTLRPDARWIAPIGAVLVLAIALVWWQPWKGDAPSQPQPVALVPTATPRSVPVAVRTPERATPSAATPTLAATPAGTPISAASPSPVATRATGILLYIGSQAGRLGIMAASADGHDKGLIVVGNYSQIAWSPKGDRFAAIGRLENLAYQVAIFAPDGRAIARYPFEGSVDRVLWSPDGAVLACAVRPATQPPAGVSDTSDVWLVTGQDEPQRVELPDHRLALPLSWTDGGQVAVIGYDSLSIDFSIWLVSRTGRNVVRSTSGGFLPLGVSADGNTAIVASALVPDPASGTSDRIVPRSIVAIDLGTDARRTIVEAEPLGQQVFGVARGASSTTFATGAIAPDGGTLALVVTRSSTIGPVQFGALEESALVFMRLDGTVTGVVPLVADSRRGLASWSPDGALLASYVFNLVSNDYTIQILDRSGALRASYNININAIGAALAPTWSPDGHWFAYSGPNGLTVASMDDLPPYSIDASGEFPVWRPERSVAP